MPKDDYFRIVFEILKDLYVAKKKAEPVSLIKISSDNLKIPHFVGRVIGRAGISKKYNRKGVHVEDLLTCLKTGKIGKT